MKIKALLSITFAILAALAIPTIAEAHNATASGTCQQGVSWSATNYDKTVTNTITVTIDGQVRHYDGDMKASDAGTIATDKTIPHSWSVVVNAPGSQYDRSFSGSYGACETAPTTTVASSTTVVTTTAPTSASAPDVATTVVTEPTTTVVAVDLPPVPTTVTPPSLLDVVSLTPAEPVLPRTGFGEIAPAVVLALLFIGAGVYLVLRGRRVQ